MSQRLAILQHAHGEGLGSMGHWFKQNNFTCHTYHLHVGEPLPNQNEFDWLVIMGGPQSAYEEETYPWLIAEKALIRDAILAGKKVLGVCLGGQLMASALGAKVSANKHSEIGWFDIQKTNPAANWLPERQTFLSWHNDIFEVPKGATGFANSEITPCQGFCYGTKAWALQFHIEAKHGTAEVFLKAGDGQLPKGQWVQDFADIKKTEHLAYSAKAASALLDFMYEQ